MQGQTRTGEQTSCTNPSSPAAAGYPEEQQNDVHGNAKSQARVSQSTYFGVPQEYGKVGANPYREPEKGPVFVL